MIARRRIFTLALISFPMALGAQRPALGAPAGPRIPPAPDRVQVTGLKVSSTAPDVGTTLSIQGTVRNADLNYALDVPWRIEVDRGTGPVAVQSGVLTALAGGASASVSASWPVVAGPVTVRLVVDPASSIAEMAPNRTNNSQHLDLTPLSARFLTFSDATRNGGTFAGNVTGTTDCPFVGVFNASDPRLLGAPGRDLPMFIADCVTRGGGAPVLMGARANPVAFGGLTLRNGWRVRSVRVLSGGTPGTRRSGNAGGSATTTPPNGSTTPAVAFSLFADRGAVFEALLEVVIEGPAHTSPF